MFFNVCLWVAYNSVVEFGQLFSGAHEALIWIRRLPSSTASSRSLANVSAPDGAARRCSPHSPTGKDVVVSSHMKNLLSAAQPFATYVFDYPKVWSQISS